MKSPLAQDKATVQELNIPKEVELHPRQKLAFLEEQLHQLQAMHFRSRIDMLHAKRLQESKNEVLKNKGFTNMSEHKNAVEQSIGGIQMISKLIEEIKADNPGLNAGEYPES